MDELEQIKMKKLQQLQQQQDASVQQDAMMQQQLEQLESVIKQKMTKSAIERYSNIKSAHPEKTLQLLAILGKAIETNKITHIDDTLLRQLLINLQSQKKDFNIKQI